MNLKLPNRVIITNTKQILKNIYNKMKKITFLLSLLCASQLSAQITVFDYTVVTTGKKSVQYNHTGEIAIQIGGANKTWDFSSLTKEEEDTIFFFNRDWVPALKNLPISANTVVTFANEPGSYILLNKSTSGLETVGSADDDGMGSYEVFPFRSSIMKFPMTYNTVLKDSVSQVEFTYELGFDPDGQGPAPKIDSIRVSSKTVNKFTGLGWGKVKLSNNVMVDAVMVEKEEILSPSYAAFVFGRWNNLTARQISDLELDNTIDSSYEHSWWSNKSEYGFPLATYNFNKGDSKTSYISHMQGELQATSVSSQNTNQISFYPNPASSTIQINGLSNTSAVAHVYDMNGKLVFTQALNNGIISLENITSGVYNVTLLDNGQLHQFKVSKI
jgi:hypothetical protein